MKRIVLAVVAASALATPAWAVCFTWQCLHEDNQALSNEIDCENAHIDWSYCMDRYDQDRETNRRLRELEDDQ